ncbi:MAG: glycerophosphodiester phosphodiesterase family protein [Pseudomonadota bacterium]
MQADCWIAHRGLPARFPENSRPGLVAALKAGARWLEVDVQLSRDGVAVLHHDRDLQRVAGIDGVVAAHPLAALQRLDFGEASRLGDRFSGTPVCTLAEATQLVAAADARLFVELKSVMLDAHSRDAIVAAVARGLGDHADRAVVIAFDATLVQAARGLTPEVGWILPSWEPASLERARSLAADYLFCNVRKIPPEPAPLPEVPSRWVVYVEDDAVAASRWLERGAWRVETDCHGGAA